MSFVIADTLNKPDSGISFDEETGYPYLSLYHLGEAGKENSGRVSSKVYPVIEFSRNLLENSLQFLFDQLSSSKKIGFALFIRRKDITGPSYHYYLIGIRGSINITENLLEGIKMHQDMFDNFFKADNNGYSYIPLTRPVDTPAGEGNNEFACFIVKQEMSMSADDMEANLKKIEVFARCVIVPVLHHIDSIYTGIYRLLGRQHSTDMREVLLDVCKRAVSADSWCLRVMDRNCNNFLFFTGNCRYLHRDFKFRRRDERASILTGNVGQNLAESTSEIIRDQRKDPRTIEELKNADPPMSPEEFELQSCMVMGLENEHHKAAIALELKPANYYQEYHYVPFDLLVRIADLQLARIESWHKVRALAYLYRDRPNLDRNFCQRLSNSLSMERNTREGPFSLPMRAIAVVQPDGRLLGSADSIPAHCIFHERFRNLLGKLIARFDHYAMRDVAYWDPHSRRCYYGSLNEPHLYSDRYTPIDIADNELYNTRTLIQFVPVELVGNTGAFVCLECDPTKIPTGQHLEKHGLKDYIPTSTIIDHINEKAIEAFLYSFSNVEIDGGIETVVPGLPANKTLTEDITTGLAEFRFLLSSIINEPSGEKWQAWVSSYRLQIEAFYNKLEEYCGY